MDTPADLATSRNVVVTPVPTLDPNVWPMNLPGSGSASSSMQVANNCQI
jgi:hypothetical protein